jgi:hypothetical protein
MALHPTQHRLSYHYQQPPSEERVKYLILGFHPLVLFYLAMLFDMQVNEGKEVQIR